MSTGTAIIVDALKRIGAASVVSPAHPESIEDGRNALNSMLERWLSENIALGVKPLDAPGDELDEPMDCRNAIVNNLALELAPLFDNGKVIVGPQLMANAKSGYAFVRRLYRNINIPDKVLSSTTPIGEGNKQDEGFYSRTFWPEGSGVKN